MNLQEKHILHENQTPAPPSLLLAWTISSGIFGEFPGVYWPDQPLHLPPVSLHMGPPCRMPTETKDPLTQMKSWQPHITYLNKNQQCEFVKCPRFRQGPTEVQSRFLTEEPWHQQFQQHPWALSGDSNRFPEARQWWELPLLQCLDWWRSFRWEQQGGLINMDFQVCATSTWKCYMKFMSAQPPYWKKS